MQILANRSLSLGLLVALVTAATAVLGVPPGLAELTVPIWDILLQLNLCSGLVFVIVGVLETMETPVPDLRSSLQLFLAAFCAYIVVCLTGASGPVLPFAVKLFLFTMSTACIAAGWALLGLSLLKRLDNQG